MKVSARFRALQPADSLSQHAHRRVHFHLSRFGHWAVDMALERAGRTAGRERARVRAPNRCTVRRRLRGPHAPYVQGLPRQADGSLQTLEGGSS